MKITITAKLTGPQTRALRHALQYAEADWESMGDDECPAVSTSERNAGFRAIAILQEALDSAVNRKAVTR